MMIGSVKYNQCIPYGGVKQVFCGNGWPATKPRYMLHLSYELD
jgi:hypothetical protein